MPANVNIGVSSCLLGAKVRYDGGHKHDRYITDTLGRFFNFIPVCPEVECGLSVPREAMRLEGNPAEPRLVTGRTRTDLTERMIDYCAGKVEELAGADLCGFIFKKGSPSSGLFRVKVYGSGVPVNRGRGLFAAAVAKRFPYLPVEEEGRLYDMDLRGNFIERVFAYRRWKSFVAENVGLGGLVRFHTCHKLQIMAHSPAIYREMGKLVAGGKGTDLNCILNSYLDLFMKALSMQSTVKKNCNVLYHVMGYFKKDLATADKQELLEIIRRYGESMLPLIVPVTMLQHYIRKFGREYLAMQTYLEPYPSELMLRNHA